MAAFCPPGPLPTTTKSNVSVLVTRRKELPIHGARFGAQKSLRYRQGKN
jgi:hypothetical protein